MADQHPEMKTYQGKAALHTGCEVPQLFNGLYWVGKKRLSALLDSIFLCRGCCASVQQCMKL
jgi:hypothetical protein